jgi:3-oxoacyl-[acyl-carrier protein] reductase
MELLKNKVIIVTGSARGIGAAIAKELALQGAKVAINYATSHQLAETLAQEIGGKAYCCDVRDQHSVQEMVTRVADDFGRIDGVVNNAIAGRQQGALEDLCLEDYQAMFDYNCLAIVNVLKALRPHFKRQGGGRVVNIVTELWNLGYGHWSPYVAGKGALVGLSRSLANELGPENITVNMVAPGWMADEKVNTDSHESRSFAQSIPLRRHGSASEVGKVCAFFFSDLASYVTGSYLPVAGGRVTQVGL